MSVPILALERLRLFGTRCERVSLTPPWSVAFEPHEHPRLYTVDGQECTLSMEHIADRSVVPGSIVLVARGRAHALASIRSADPAPTTLGSAMLGGDQQPHPVLARLPDAVVIAPGDPDRSPWLDDIAGLFTAETAGDRPGGDAVSVRLAEVLFMHVVRIAIRREPPVDLEPAIEQDLGELIGALHDEPRRKWTLVEMAERCNTSRSHFVRVFRSVVGETPADYLKRARIQHALALLSSGKEVSVGEVAQAAGYESEAAFCRAFKRSTGKTPTEFRQRRPDDPVE